jgi:GT2 family glycosyltransferase
VSCLVTAIVVAYTDVDVVTRCLSSVEAALSEVDGESEAIVVLNRQMHDFRQTVGDFWAVLEPGRNVGFAGGVNAGLSRARGEWIALINDDCEVEPRAIFEMLAAGSMSSTVGSVAAQILFADSDTINSAGIEVDEIGVAHELLLGAPAGAGGTDVAEVFGACGAAALYRRTMLDAVGGFDESFFAYLEDADLAWRSRMAGWRSVYAPRAVVRHHHSSSLGHQSAQKSYLVGRNRVRMLAKNATKSQLVRRCWAILIYDFAYVTFGLTKLRSLAPLRGRISGLRQWRRYRAAGRPHRSTVALAGPTGLRMALRRNRAYRRVRGPTRPGTSGLEITDDLDLR